MSQNDSLEKILKNIPELKNIPSNRISILVDFASQKKYNKDDIEKLASQLDEEKKQTLLNILKSIK